MGPNSQACSGTVQALLGLRPSGEKSFEELICLLLADLTGLPFRRLRAGYQGGIDTRSETGVGVEVKRYEPDSRLSEEGLLGKLGQTATSHNDLDVWVLVTTQQVDGGLVEKLQILSRRLGFASFCLDASAGHPLPYPAIAALAAVKPDRVISALSDPEWLDRTKLPEFDTDAVLEELRAIESDSRFEEWAETLRRKLQGLPTWERVRREQNYRIRRQIIEEPFHFSGTSFDWDKAVRREVESALTEWIKSAKTAPEPPLCAMLGERYDGKTWAMLHWLLNQSSTLQLPVFIFPAKKGDQGQKLIDLIVGEVASVLEVGRENAEGLVRRIAKSGAVGGPWALIILDGLNEYRAYPEASLDHLVQATASAEDRQPAAVLVTARTVWWDDHSPRITVASRATRVVVGPYSEGELEIALRKRGEEAAVLAAVPPSARHYLYRPRYLGLVIEHKNRLEAFGVITTDVLHYLDAMDKMRDHGHLAGAMDWDHLAYSEFLSGLARKYLSGSGIARRLERRELNTILDDLVDEKRAALRDLESSRVVTRAEQGYSVDSGRLATGMGLWLPLALEISARKGDDLREALRELLEPMAETDEKVEWLKAAVTFILFSSDQDKERADILDVLVDEWLRSRNLGATVLQDVQTLAHQLLPSLIRLAVRSWSEHTGDRRLQEISLLTFVQEVQKAASPGRQLIETAARDWCRMLPQAGTRFLRSDNPEKEIRSRREDPSLTSLNLKLAEDEGVTDLQRVSLYLESVNPSVLDAESILTFFAVSQLAPNPLDSAEYRVARQVLARTERSWFAQRYAQGSSSERWRALWFRLICTAQRADLNKFKELVKPLPNPKYDELWAQHQFKLRDYLKAGLTPSKADDKPLRFAARARPFVADPEMPKPTAERVAAIAAFTLEKFKDVRLQEGRSISAEDNQFRDIVPALAAWAPAAGTSAIQAQVADLPKRFDDEDSTYFTHHLDRHASTLRGRARQALRTVLKEYPDNQRQFASGLAFAAFLPGLRPKARLDTFINHPLRLNNQDWEWTDLYELAAWMADQQFVRELMTRLEIERDSRRTNRLRLLFTQIGNLELSESQHARLVEDLHASNATTLFSALAVAEASPRVGLPADSLLKLVRDGDARASLTPRYAAWLLVRSSQHLDELPIIWQAEAAVRYPERRERFLAEVDRALHHMAGTEGLIVLPENVQIKLRAGHPVNQRVGVNSGSEDSRIIFGSGRGGLGGLEEPTPFDPKTLAKEWGADNVADRNRLATEAAAHFAAQADKHESTWESELFPRALVENLTQSQFLRWSERLTSGAFPIYRLWTGLLHPMLHRALREGSSLAHQLFDLVYPFNRRIFGGGVTFLRDDLPLALHTLFNRKADEALARGVLERLLRDCRSDFELQQVVLAARRGRLPLLEQVVDEWLETSCEDLRARAVRLSGWLPELPPRLVNIAATDVSLHVRDLAEAAIYDWLLERWAKHWFALFLANGPSADRWGAGQLFLECADQRVFCWAESELRNVLNTRTRGEGFLLLKAARREMSNIERGLKDNFLGARVSELKELCRPWRVEPSWHRLRST